jgi:L-alanine-DL-glutamate epimerase-like enolase superfamily enzyme
VFFMNPAASLWGDSIDVNANGTIKVPQGPGLGYEPDKRIIERYRVS